eukprot:4828007-Pyramimonas_sp.AAC.1
MTLDIPQKFPVFLMRGLLVIVIAVVIVLLLFFSGSLQQRGARFLSVGKQAILTQRTPTSREPTVGRGREPPGISRQP